MGAVAKDDTVMRCARYRDVNTSLGKEKQVCIHVCDVMIRCDDDSTIDKEEERAKRKWKTMAN
jgi:hypothetical protein